jgi:hypothetical protein
MDNKLFHLLDTVIMTANLSTDEVLAGDLGTIVEIYTDPSSGL